MPALEDSVKGFPAARGRYGRIDACRGMPVTNPDFRESAMLVPMILSRLSGKGPVCGIERFVMLLSYTLSVMNKTQLAEAMAQESGLSKIDAAKALNAFIQVTVRTLRADGKILLTGLGTFTTVRYAERMGRNPRSGAPVRIPARRVVRFRPSRTMEE